MISDYFGQQWKYVKDSKYPLFILETNGILFGADRNYVKQLKEFNEKLYVRVSFKAAVPEGFTQRTGALGEYYELPFKALESLLEEGISARAAAMTDLGVMPREEKKILIDKLNMIDPKANYSSTLEEEQMDRYDTTLRRLKAFTDLEFAKKLEKSIEEKFK
jgi:uncharacterized Fe-S cluster-containing radical SAM superfamily protein